MEKEWYAYYARYTQLQEDYNELYKDYISLLARMSEIANRARHAANDCTAERKPDIPDKLFKQIIEDSNQQ